MRTFNFGHVGKIKCANISYAKKSYVKISQSTVAIEWIQFWWMDTGNHPKWKPKPMIKGLFNLEKVSKRPAPQHLKEGMMVGVLSNIVQVTVLPSSLNGLLRVGSTNQPFHVTSRVNYKMGRGRSRRERRRVGKREGRRRTKGEEEI